MGRFFRRFGRKVKSHGLFTFLAVISIVGFSLQSVRAFFGVDLVGTFSWASVLLGVGLVFESQLKRLLSGRVSKEDAVPKIITLLVGLVVAFGGLLTLPFLIVLGVELTGVWGGVVGFANVIAIFVILYELFIID